MQHACFYIILYLYFSPEACGLQWENFCFTGLAEGLCGYSKMVRVFLPYESLIILIFQLASMGIVFACLWQRQQLGTKMSESPVLEMTYCHISPTRRAKVVNAMATHQSRAQGWEKNWSQ